MRKGKHHKKSAGSRFTIDGRVFNCKIVKPKKRRSYAVCSNPAPERKPPPNKPWTLNTREARRRQAKFLRESRNFAGVDG